MLRFALSFGSSVALGLSLGCASQRAAPPPSDRSKPPSRMVTRVPVGAPAAGHVRIAAVQYEIRGERPLSDILSEARTLVRQAARAQAELVVFPELLVLDVWPQTVGDERAFVRRVASEHTPAALEAFASIAEESSVAVLAGSFPEIRGRRLYNTAYLFFPKGRKVRQDKMYLTAWGKRMGMTPGHTLSVFDAPWGKSVILVCYDIEIPTLSARLVEKQPEVILVPSMTESEHGLGRVRWSAQARAVEHHAFVVVASTVGQPSPTWAHFGQSVVVTPRDEGFPGILAEAPRAEPTILFADLDVSALRRSRAQTTFYPARDELARRAGGPREE